jgi:hypothetical protein
MPGSSSLTLRWLRIENSTPLSRPDPGHLRGWISARGAMAFPVRPTLRDASTSRTFPLRSGSRLRARGLELGGLPYTGTWKLTNQGPRTGGDVKRVRVKWRPPQRVASKPFAAPRVMALHRVTAICAKTPTESPRKLQNRRDDGSPRSKSTRTHRSPIARRRASCDQGRPKAESAKPGNSCTPVAAKLPR